MKKEHALQKIKQILSLVDVGDFSSLKNRFEYLMHPEQLESAFRFVQQMKSTCIPGLASYKECPQKQAGGRTLCYDTPGAGYFFCEYVNGNYESEGFEVSYSTDFNESVCVKMNRSRGTVESFIMASTQFSWLCTYSKEVYGRKVNRYQWQIMKSDGSFLETDSM